MSPLEEAINRLQEWTTTFSLGGYEKPTYKNPGELKVDIQLLLSEYRETTEKLYEAVSRSGYDWNELFPEDKT